MGCNPTALEDGRVSGHSTALRICLSEGIVDRDGGERALGSGGNHQLHTSAGIAYGVESGDAGRAFLVAADEIFLLAEFATELKRQR